jgi:hypothetical protein
MMMFVDVIVRMLSICLFRQLKKVENTESITEKPKIWRPSAENPDGILADAPNIVALS